MGCIMEWSRPTVHCMMEPTVSSNLDPAPVDAVLATTRAVRRRLDLQRPVDNQILLDCIDLAEQAPTGGNLGSRRWIIVRDQDVKDQLGELYRATAVPFMAPAVERLRGTGLPQERVMESALYLAEHLAEVPAIVIPTIIGRHDGGTRPGLFDSVIQAAWSFCLALRARGLGTTWVTAALQDEARVKEILGIPDHMTEIVLFPVAFTKGTDFSRAPRRPARQITYFDRFGTTSGAGPGGALSFDDGPGIVTETDIDASPATVWALITDINLPAQFSNEFLGATWDTDERGVGAVFHGTNQHPALGEWTIPCSVDTRTEQRAFGWCTSDPDRPGARWCFELEPSAGRTRLRFSYTLGPGKSGTTMAIANNPGKEARVLRRRLNDVQTNMQRTVDGIKTIAEGGS
jgi:nitroreductase